ncbi:hypothetical protein [Romboutsia sp. 13368]|uniref:hypothetical protein n=1 Tax=Romboutsia sp. 13368 TaxID=2708053 RepID=UPI0025D3DAC4|nr:hypothetical protein [Romboutsia sp. 13368]
MKKIIITLLLFMIVLLSACSTNENSIKILQPSEVEQKKSGNYEVQTMDFNVGEIALDGISYDLKGTMSIPKISKNKKMKLVIIIPGYYNNIDRYDKGFEYLINYIAENGYLAIAIDTSPAYYLKYIKNKEYESISKILNEHIKVIEQANFGNNIYNVDFENKIELKSITLISHCVNIEEIFKTIQKQNTNEVKILNLLLINPITNKYISDFNIKSVSILISGLDGTRMGIDGFNIYRILKEYNNQDILSLTLLKNANNNYFNSKIEQNDANQLDIDLKNQINRKEQEEFLKRFVVDYLKAVYKDKCDNTIYDTKLTTVTKINNLDVINYLQTSKVKKLKDIKDLDAYKAKNIKINLLNNLPEVNLPKMNEDSIKLLNIKWEYKNGRLTFKPDINDFSKFNNISINLVLDPENESNIKGKPQSICIELVDDRRNSQKVEISKESNLINYPSGDLEEFDRGDGKEFICWNQITPILNIRIPIVMYNTINLKNIKKCNIIFDRTNSGDLLFESFTLD